jgi:predicted RNA methylase
MKRVVDKEQYFTSPELASKCVALVNEIYPLDEFEIIIEPSAGDGAFLRLLPASTSLGVDIAPMASNILKSDFLEWLPSKITARSKVLVIGNPPFGARASIALKFIDHAATFSDVIAFVLPMSFKKYTFQNMLPRNLHLVKSIDCADVYETPNGAVKVNTVFQIWEKRTELRPKIERKMNHPHFQMKHAHLSRTSDNQLAKLRQEFEFAVAQVGSNFAPKDPSELDKGSYWFISPTVPYVKERFNRMDFSHLDGMNLAHKSLSKSDIIEAYEAVLAADGIEIQESILIQDTLY